MHGIQRKTSPVRILQGPTRASLAALLAMNIWSRIVSPFFSSLLIFHLTGPNCPSLQESRQDSQNLLWPTGGTAMPILLSSCSEAHLTPLGGGEPVPISGFQKNATAQKRPLEAGLPRGSNDLVHCLRCEKSASWFTSMGRKTLYNGQIYGLDQLTLIQTKMGSPTSKTSDSGICFSNKFPG